MVEASGAARRDGERATASVPGAEAVVNGDGEVAVFVRALPSRPLGVTAEPGCVVRVSLGDGADAFLGLPPEAYEAVVAAGRLLLAEVGPSGSPERESWVALSPATES